MTVYEKETQKTSRVSNPATNPNNNRFIWHCHKIDSDDGTIFCLDTHDKVAVQNVAVLGVFYQGFAESNEHNKQIPMVMLTESIAISIEVDNAGNPPEHSTNRYRFFIKDIESGFVYFNQILANVHIDLNGDWLWTVTFTMTENDFFQDTVKFCWGWNEVSKTTDITNLFLGGC